MMKRLNAALVGVDQGEVALFDHFSVESPMWTETGRRQIAREVEFTEPFLEPPSVTLQIRMLDANSETHLRMSLTADDVTTHKFRVAFNTWNDTKIARMSVAWTAIGMIADPDEFWDV